VATCDGLYPLRLSQACDICDRSLEVIVKEGLIKQISQIAGNNRNDRVKRSSQSNV
jgi:hypothetical protein